MTDYETDGFFDNATSKAWSKFRIYDKLVEVRLVSMELPVGTSLLKGKKAKEWKKRCYFNAYVELKGSQNLSDTFLGHPTFRDGDWVGVDTAHAFNENETMSQKLASALHQIESTIEVWKTATQEGFYKEVE